MGFKDVPILKSSKEEKERLRQPWRQPLIINLLGQTVGYDLLCKKLLQIWSPKGELVRINLSNKFFIATFFLPEDYYFVVGERPWMIFDHYLAIRRWHPGFEPNEPTIDRVAIWVKFPNISIELLLLAKNQS
ncbi:hypothetical protein EUGRSUZ_H03558 [Eucalyptus grandis]|uniref:DUF4283 domain-containing protein n=2 Tax=Eucalyptus grandis TaxID=71139 RepID=A0A059B588_EUCGR|nr:hypothetical protein EUGRSUZ_H03558 [Eucalyptus grandis]